MPDVLDYLDWRGDVPFSVSPVNEIDDFILCKIGTPDLRRIVPAGSGCVPVGRAAEAYLAAGGEWKLGAVASRHTVPVFRRLGDTARFGDLMLSGFRLTVDESRTEQFSAMTIRLPGGGHAVTFRGTDDTLVGWKENFLLTVRSATEAQEHALRYLCWAADTYPGELAVSGHSKGGNLAVYAAAMAPEEVQKRIVRVMCFDGPGFQPEFFEQPGFGRVRDRIRCFLPQGSLIGTLLYQAADRTILASASRSLAAHDGFTWETTPTGFARREELTAYARAYEKAMKEVLAGMSLEERQEFIEEFFGTLGATGAVTLTDVTEQRLRQAWQMMRSLHQEPGVRRLAMDTLEALTRSYVAQRGRDLPRLRLPSLPRRFRRKEKADPAEAGEE